MKNRRVVVGTLAAAGFAAVAAVVILAQVQDAEAGPCRCPKIYAPVICDHGRSFANPCLAECHNATNCVPDPNRL